MSEDKMDMLKYLELKKIKSLEKQVEAGTVLIQEGYDNRAMYILVKGKIEILQNKKVINEISEPGEYFGEINVLLDIPHSATCIAKVDTTVLEIPSENIESFITSTPEIGLILARKLARRLIKSDERYQKLHYKLKTQEPENWLKKTT